MHRPLRQRVTAEQSFTLEHAGTVGRDNTNCNTDCCSYGDFTWHKL